MLMGYLDCQGFYIMTTPIAFNHWIVNWKLQQKGNKDGERKKKKKPKKRGGLRSKVIHQVNLFYSSPVIQRNWKFSFGVLVHGWLHFLIVFPFPLCFFELNSGGVLLHRIWASFPRPATIHCNLSLPDSYFQYRPVSSRWPLLDRYHGHSVRASATFYLVALLHSVFNIRSISLFEWLAIYFP